jgi:hypothetical protein
MHEIAATLALEQTIEAVWLARASGIALAFYTAAAHPD